MYIGGGSAGGHKAAGGGAGGAGGRCTNTEGVSRAREAREESKGDEV